MVADTAGAVVVVVGGEREWGEGGGAVYITLPFWQTVRGDRTHHCEKEAVQQKTFSNDGPSRKRVLKGFMYKHGAIADTIDHVETNQSSQLKLESAQMVQPSMARSSNKSCKTTGS